MYEVILKTYVNDVREADSKCANTYASKGWAERRAKKETVYGDNILGERVRILAYVRGELEIVSEEEAKKAYCKGKPVYADSEFGKDRLRPSWEYGSHASREELFYRSASTFSYGLHYEGNYYIEKEER